MTKSISEKIKGIAVLLMIAHHSFLVIPPDTGYIPAIPLLGFSVEHVLAVLGKICVGLFAFVSGYGLYLANKGAPEYKPQIKRIFHFYKMYWAAVFFTVIIYLAVQPNAPALKPSKILLDLTGYSTNLIASWWYAAQFLLFLLVLPLFHYVLKDRLPVIAVVSILIYSFSSGALIPAGARAIEHIKILAWTHKSFPINVFMFLQIIFVSGYLFAGYDLLNKISFRIRSIPRLPKRIFLFTCLTLICFIRYYAADIYMWLNPEYLVMLKTDPLIRYIAAYYLDFIFVPVFIILFANILKEKRGILSFFGKHSANMWLLHGAVIMAIYPLFNIVRWTPLILTATVSLSVLYSVIYFKTIGMLKRFCSKRRIPE